MAHADPHPRRGTLRPHPDVVARRVADEVVLVQLQSNQIFALNRTGARFWELVSSGMPSREAAQRMLDEFDVSAERLEEEVEGILQLLLDEHLLIIEET
jgi:coenzyme PQQ synthesis protein D (PqqD)